jgi:very-short-patch-repair endonuclease
MVLKKRNIANDDLEFVKNLNDHFDFVLFSILDNQIRLAIDVDRYLPSKSVQKERDKRKYDLLEQAGIRVLRLQPNAIDCDKAIKKELRIMMRSTEQDVS